MILSHIMSVITSLLREKLENFEHRNVSMVR